MKNGNYLDAKVVIQPKQTMPKCFQQQLNETNDMLSKPQENITLKQNHAHNQKVESIQSSKNRILIVDDNDENRELLEIFLGEYGYDVVSASNGQEAWTLFQKENFDLVLTDICMPGMNGNDLAKYIKNDRKALPIIAMTGSSWLAENGFDEIMTKPVWLHALLDSIKNQLTKASVLLAMAAEDS
jgi:CheY-like chemotaxis protein